MLCNSIGSILKLLSFAGLKFPSHKWRLLGPLNSQDYSTKEFQTQVRGSPCLLYIFFKKQMNYHTYFCAIKLVIFTEVCFQTLLSHLVSSNPGCPYFVLNVYCNLGYTKVTHQNHFPRLPEGALYVWGGCGWWMGSNQFTLHSQHKMR